MQWTATLGSAKLKGLCPPATIAVKKISYLITQYFSVTDLILFHLFCKQLSSHHSTSNSTIEAVWPNKIFVFVSKAKK
jgi:hypothetical protein